MLLAEMALSEKFCKVEGGLEEGDADSGLGLTHQFNKNISFLWSVVCLAVEGWSAAMEWKKINVGNREGLGECYVPKGS